MVFGRGYFRRRSDVSLDGNDILDSGCISHDFAELVELPSVRGGSNRRSWAQALEIQRDSLHSVRFGRYRTVPGVGYILQA